MLRRLRHLSLSLALAIGLWAGPAAGKQQPGLPPLPGTLPPLMPLKKKSKEPALPSLPSLSKPKSSSPRGKPEPPPAIAIESGGRTTKSLADFDKGQRFEIEGPATLVVEVRRANKKPSVVKVIVGKAGTKVAVLNAGSQVARATIEVPPGRQVYQVIAVPKKKHPGEVILSLKGESEPLPVAAAPEPAPVAAEVPPPPPPPARVSEPAPAASTVAAMLVGGSTAPASSGEIAYKLSMVYELIKRQDFNTALLVSHEILTADPVNAATYRNLGITYSHLGARTLACESYRRYLRFGPDVIDRPEVERLIQACSGR